MANLYTEFKKLIPAAPLMVGEITLVDAGGVTLTLPDGSVTRARGAGTVGAMVFVRDGVVEGAAPTLAVVEIEV